jgi:Tfp pilus assembly protein PilX
MINFIYNKPSGFTKKGIALFMVLGTLLVVVILAFIMLNIILSHSRLTQHQVNRIQAYYAAMAGINYALEQLRIGAWTFNNPNNSCQDPVGCNLPPDPDFPNAIQYVNIIFCPTGTLCAGASASCQPPAGSDFCVNSTAHYASPPS